MRIIDANLNRAREALRVMEEYARLGLDDAGLTAAIKETRHALAAAVNEFEQKRVVRANGTIARAKARGSGDADGTSARAEARGSEDAIDRHHNKDDSPHTPPPLSPPLARAEDDVRGSVVAHRDIVGDVGCEVATAAEYERSDSGHVALAAAKRLSEALRAVEEYGKTIDDTFAKAVEKIRYRGYELERRLHVTANAKERFGHVRLYVIITELLCKGDWLATAEAALRGGADCLQLREKDLSDRELLERAKQLAKLCHGHDALFVVNDRPDIASLTGADGAHLGQRDLPVAAARRVVPPTCLIGVSTHTEEQVKAAAAAVPDYIAVGPMFPTSTKPQDHIAGAKTLAAAKRHTSLPLVAIGGIQEGNIKQVLSAAPCAICVCQAVVGQKDVTAAASRLRLLIVRVHGDGTTG